MTLRRSRGYRGLFACASLSLAHRKPTDWGYWNALDLWPLDAACKLISGDNPAELTRPREIENPDTLARPAWVNLYHTVMSGIGAKKLRCYAGGVDPKELLAWAQEKGITIPDEVRPSTTISPDNEPIARRKAPDKFIAAVIRLIAENEYTSCEKWTAVRRDRNAGEKSGFYGTGYKVRRRTRPKTPRTFDDYLAGLLRFKQGARETTFYKELFPEFFAPRRSDP